MRPSALRLRCTIVAPGSGRLERMCRLEMMAWHPRSIPELTMHGPLVRDQCPTVLCYRPASEL